MSSLDLDIESWGSNGYKTAQQRITRYRLR